MKKLVGFFVLFLMFATTAFASEGAPHSVSLITTIPFAILLLSMAILPLLNKEWWEHNYPKFAFGLATVVIVYYVFALNDYVSVWHAGIDYFGFMAMVGSFFVIASCILVKIDRRPTPLTNSVILLVGAIICNFLSTTGAAILLVRPFLKINKNQSKPYRIAFFIFIVCNIGGLLTPLGGPPLFLGFLKGVPFTWPAQNLWKIWLVANGLLLTMFYLIDKKNYVDDEKTYSNKIEIIGKQNFIYLGVVVLAILFAPTPIREIIMIMTSVFVYQSTNKAVLEENDFEFDPLKEVGILFFGIFACMIPALQWLAVNASSLGIQTPSQFYYGSGGLSAILDNAPTYLNFLMASFGANGMNMDTQMTEYLVIHGIYLVAISAGASCFGAMTYIGNAPNFMVVKIGNNMGLEVPDFMKYIYAYSIPLLLPVLVAVSYIFF